MRTEVLELTEEQLKTLNLFSYYSRGYGGDEVTKEYYFEDGSLDWEEDYWQSSSTHRGIESYDKIDELIEDIIRQYDLEELSDNRMTLTFNIDCIEKILTITASEMVISQEFSLSTEEIYDEERNVDEELITYFKNMKSEGFVDGTIRFDGSGDSGSIDDNITLYRNTGPTEDDDVDEDIENLCYVMLREYPGWEINEGSSGEFNLNFETGIIELNYGQNIEDDMGIDYRGYLRF